MLKVLSLIFLLFFFSSQETLAAFSFNIDSVSLATITSGDQEVEVNLSITDLPSESYFRVAIQKESGGSYYGYVKNNNGEWAAIQSLNGNCSTYFKVSDTSATSLTLSFKLGDETVDNGSYNLKAHRFTSTGSCSYTQATNDYPVTLFLTTPAPTPSPTSSPTSTTIPVPTSTKTPTSKPLASKPTTTPMATSISISLAADEEVTESSVLSDSSVSVEEETGQTSTPRPVETKVASENNLAPILIGAGIILLMGSIFLIRRSLTKNE